MTFKLFSAAMALMVLPHALFVVAQEDVNNLAYQEYEYHFQNESFVVTCPPVGGLPPFRLDEPSMTARTKGVVLDYPVQVPDPEWVSFQVFDFDCVTPIPTSTTDQTDPTQPIVADLQVKSSLYPDGEITLGLEIDPNNMLEYGSLFYTEESRSGEAPAIVSRGTAKLCVRMSLYNGPVDQKDLNSTEVIEVTFLETQIIFQARLEVESESMLNFNDIQSEKLVASCTGNGCRRNLVGSANGIVLSAHAGDEEVSRSSHHRHLCESTWGVEVFTCPDDIDLNSPVTNLSPTTTEDVAMSIPQAVPIRVCVQPNNVTRAAGVVLKQIESLYFMNPKSTDLAMTQPAVEGGFDSADERSVQECGAAMCVVETTLYPNFFGDGTPPNMITIMATGKARFQPSEETSYGLIEVDFSLELPIEPSKDSSAANAIWVAGMWMMMSSMLFFV